MNTKKDLELPNNIRLRRYTGKKMLIAIRQLKRTESKMLNQSTMKMRKI
jgi:hypothetical protein